MSTNSVNSGVGVCPCACTAASAARRELHSRGRTAAPRVHWSRRGRISRCGARSGTRGGAPRRRPHSCRRGQPPRLPARCAGSRAAPVLVGAPGRPLRWPRLRRRPRHGAGRRRLAGDRRRGSITCEGHAGVGSDPHGGARPLAESATVWPLAFTHGHLWGSLSAQDHTAVTQTLLMICFFH